MDPTPASLLASARALVRRAQREDHADWTDLLLDAVSEIADATDLLLADVRALQTAAERVVTYRHDSEQHEHGSPAAPNAHLFPVVSRATAERATLDTAFDAHARLPLARTVYGAVREAGDHPRGLAATFEREPALKPFVPDVNELRAILERLGIDAINHVAKGTTDAE